MPNARLSEHRPVSSIAGEKYRAIHYQLMRRNVFSRVHEVLQYASLIRNEYIPVTLSLLTFFPLPLSSEYRTFDLYIYVTEPSPTLSQNEWFLRASAPRGDTLTAKGGPWGRGRSSSLSVTFQAMSSSTFAPSEKPNSQPLQHASLPSWTPLAPKWAVATLTLCT